MSDNVTRVTGCTSIDQLVQLADSSLSNNNEAFKMAFFYNPPTDHQIYHIICELLTDNINSISDHTFVYQPADDKNIYRISCNLISHSLIVQFLNKRMYGIELRQEESQQEYLTFSSVQRNNLEFHLKEFLFNSLASKPIDKQSNLNAVKQEETCSKADNRIIAQPKL